MSTVRLKVATRFDDDELAKTLCDEDGAGPWPALTIAQQDRYRDLATAARHFLEAEADAEEEEDEGDEDENTADALERLLNRNTGDRAALLRVLGMLEAAALEEDDDDVV